MLTGFTKIFTSSILIFSGYVTFMDFRQVALYFFKNHLEADKSLHYVWKTLHIDIPRDLFLPIHTRIITESRKSYRSCKMNQVWPSQTPQK